MASRVLRSAPRSIGVGSQVTRAPEGASVGMVQPSKPLDWTLRTDPLGAARKRAAPEHQAMMRWFWTSFAPGAAHAVSPANSRSLQELTWPAKVTVPPSAVTSIPAGPYQDL